MIGLIVCVDRMDSICCTLAWPSGHKSSLYCGPVGLLLGLVSVDTSKSGHRWERSATPAANACPGPNGRKDQATNIAGYPEDIPKRATKCKVKGRL